MDVWYAAYGSNLSRARFMAYLAGGRPPGAARTYPGARDPSAAYDDRPLTLAGGLFFAWASTTWGGGGVAFYDAQAEGSVLARAWRVTQEQFEDVAAQEMGRAPGGPIDLGTVLSARVHAVGPGRYETVHLVGELEGLPVLTVTAPVGHGLPLNPPSAAYRDTVVRGLVESHGLSEAAAEDYLARWPPLRGR